MRCGDFVGVLFVFKYGVNDLDRYRARGNGNGTNARF